MSTANPDFDLFQLSEDHEALRDAVRAVAEDKIAPYAAAVDEEARYPQEAHDALVASDFFAPHIPEEYDGVGADALATCIVIEEVARVCASSSLIPAVNKLGHDAADPRRERGRQGALPPAGRARARRCSPTGCPSARPARDTAAMKCRATRGRRRLGAQRARSRGSPTPGLGVLHGARGDRPRGPPRRQRHRVRRGEVRRGLHLRGEGAQARHQGLARPASCIFDNVRIPGDRIVGAPGEGLKIALRTLDHTRVTIGAQAVGIAQGALDFAVAYVKERKQFGKHIAEFQGIQFMLADMAMKLEAARQMVYVAAAKSERGDADLPFFGAAAKCYASDVAMEVTTDAVQLLGGAGYSSDFPVERMMRDAKITQIYEGTNQIQRVVMARQLLK